MPNGFLRLPSARTILRVWLIFLCMCCPALAAPRAPRVRVSAWYWLNSVPEAQWPADFANMKQLGLTDVVLVWGMDGAAFSSRIHDSHRAIDAAHKAGLGSYLFIWHARYSSLPHDPRFEQVDAAGQTLYAFDTFNPQWRQTQWKKYLQSIARAYGHEPGLAGYVFDNSFAIGHVSKVDGDAPTTDANYISYGEAERKLFGSRPPVSPSDAAWAAWTTARQQWWADWANDTRDAIRAIDPNPHHEIVLEDGQNTIDPDVEARAGLSLKRVAPFFDIMSAYWAPHYSDQGVDLAKDVATYLTQIRAVIGPTKELSLSLRLSDDATEDSAGHANKPTLTQIKLAIDAALAVGVKRIDLYGYRMGVYHLENPGWSQYLPGAAKTYPLTHQIEGKFLVDRPELWPGLKDYFAQIAAASE
jgi:hypothetical protein